jgi:hypothetical protein
MLRKSSRLSNIASLVIEYVITNRLLKERSTNSTSKNLANNFIRRTPKLRT